MDDKERASFLNGMKTFLRLCKEELGLQKLPKIVWVTDDSLRRESPTFGRFGNDDETIQVDVRNRHPLDVMRTLAHELTHYKQWLSGQIHPDSGETGSEQENQAHATAGIIMRHYDRAYPESFNSKPISEDNRTVRRIEPKTLNTLYNIQAYDRDLQAVRAKAAAKQREKDSEKSRDKKKEMKAAGTTLESPVKVYMIFIQPSLIRKWRETRDRDWALSHAKLWGKINKNWPPEVINDIHSNPVWQENVIKLWDLADLILKIRDMPIPNRGAASGMAALGRVGADSQDVKDAYYEITKVVKDTLRKHNIDKSGLRLPSKA